MIEIRSPSRSASSRSWLTNRIVFLTRACSAEQLVLQLVADQRVERRERLVHQQDVRVRRERAREPDALLHAAGQFADIAGPPTATGRPARAAPRRSPCALAAGSPRSSRPKPTFSATVRQGSRPNCWNTIATRSRRRRRRSSALQRPTSIGAVRVVDQHLPARHGVQAVGGAHAASTCRSPTVPSSRRSRPARSRGSRRRRRRPRRRPRRSPRGVAPASSRASAVAASRARPCRPRSRGKRMSTSLNSMRVRSSGDPPRRAAG